MKYQLRTSVSCSWLVRLWWFYFTRAWT